MGGAGLRTAGPSSFCPHLIREGLVSPLGGHPPFNLQAPAAPGCWVSAHNADKSLLSCLEKWWAWRAGQQLRLLLEGPVLLPPSKLWASERPGGGLACEVLTTFYLSSWILSTNLGAKRKIPPVNLPQSTEPSFTPASLPLPHATRTSNTGGL